MSVKRICEYCNQEFHVSPSRIVIGKGKFCSSECAAKSRTLPLIAHKCEQCGIIFYAKREHNNRRFCSKSCSMSWRLTKPPVYVKCENCGIEFKIRPYKLGKVNLRFCSRKCTYEYRSKTHYNITPDGIKKSAKAKIGKKRKPFSESHKKRIGDTRRGEKNWHWKGGLSFEPYCPKFNNKLKEEIREAFGRKCFLCGSPENGRGLSVHHINFDKKAGCYGRKFNLLPLCNSCHAKTTMHKHYYFTMLSNYWALDPEINFDGGYHFIHKKS